MPRSTTVLPPVGWARRQFRTRARALLGAVAVLVAVLAPLAPATAAADGEQPVMTAAVMLEGHGRVGSWMAVQVRLRNDGPSMAGELRLAGGAQGRTRFGTPVDLPRGSDKTYLMYAQPPAFGGSLDVTLETGGATVASHEVAYTVHEMSQLVVGVVAEEPEGILPRVAVAPAAAGARPATFALGVEDLPERIEAWAPLDRLIWQDVDSSQLTAGQLAALRGWVASGGRLIVVGGTGGGPVLAGFPEDLLPYRPTATVDVPPDALAPLLGEVPAESTDVIALGGELVRGRPLASVGDSVVAAEAAYGLGGVTILGFDPARGWIGELDAVEALWARFLPPRVNGATVTGDDNQMINAVSRLPALALPPIGGLLVLLAGYIALIGPVNYLVLRRLDRREWAWVTMPLLILVFAAGAYGFGAALRGLDVIVNEVAIVRGAPGATEGTAQVYLGVFSPSRGTYQVEVPGGALLSSTVAGEFVGGNAAALDVVQGDPSRVRDLVVGFGSLRTLRAETATTVPQVSSDLSLREGRLVGTVRNDSQEVLERPAIVLGSSVLVLRDMPPGTQHTIDLVVRPNQFGQSLAERLLGTVFMTDTSRANETAQRTAVRHAVINQLTFNPVSQHSTGLAADTPVFLAWGRRDVLDVRISGQVPRRTGNVLYYVPLSMRVQGKAVFEGELIRSSVVESDSANFAKDPQVMFGRGSLTMAYRPIPFEGTLATDRLTFGVGFGDPVVGAARGVEVEILDPQPCRDEPTDEPDCVEPVPPDCDPLMEDCSMVGLDGIPEVEVFDRESGTWIRVRKPAMGVAYELPEPERYVDPASGTLLVRFVSDFQDITGFDFRLRIEGTVQ